MPGGRVLMIAHHFPPAGGSGANRSLAMATFLGEYGWVPTVVTPGVGWAANRDDGLLGEVPRGVRVVRTRSFEAVPARTEVLAGGASRSPGNGVPKWRRLVRSNAGHLKRFPDGHLGWVPFALAAATREHFEVVYSSSGPFSSHIVGLLLKRITNRPWVAELRDGWYRWNRAIFPDYPAWRDVLERRLEALVVRHADRVVLVTDRMANAFRRQYADLPREHFGVVPNGFDSRQFAGTAAATAASKAPLETDTFEVLHSGALYYGRSVAAFLAAVERLLSEDVAFSQAFRLTLVGTLDAAAQAELRGSALGERVCYRGQVAHAASLAAMRAADLLLLVANTTAGAEATVPGKLFEYLGARKPILAIAPPASSTRDVLERTGGAFVAPAGDAGAIARVLRAAFVAHQRDEVLVPDGHEVARFDRRVIAADLARIFDQLVAPADARRI